VLTSVHVEASSFTDPVASSTTGILSLMLLIVIPIVAVSAKTPSLPLIVKVYHVTDSKSKLLVSTTTTVSPEIPNIPSLLPHTMLYVIGSPSASLPERVATSVHVATSSFTDPVASSTTAILSLILLIVIVMVAVSAKTPSLPLIVKVYQVTDS
jgi:hypothetical protein